MAAKMGPQQTKDEETHCLDSAVGEHAQLKQFVRRIAEVQAAGGGAAELRAVVSAMLEFARAHIQDEEAVMAAVCYPDLRSHRDVHEGLLRRLAAVAAALAEEAPPPGELEAVLGDWLEQHLSGPDLKFLDFLMAFHLRRIRSGEQDGPASQPERERFRAIVEASPNAILVVDSAGLVCVVNSEVERLFGYGREELIGQQVEKLMPAAVRSRHAGNLAAFSASPEVRAMGAGRDLFGLRRDGVEIPIEIGLSPLQAGGERLVLASIIDISKRKELDALVREAHADALRDSILKSMPSSVIATDTAGRIVAINPAAERLLGYGRDELIGHPVLMLHDPDELKRRAADASRATGKAIMADFQVLAASAGVDGADGREWVYIRKDGSCLPVQVALTQLRGTGEEISGFLAVANDITERKRAEASIRYMADHDALTGLPNRNLLVERINMAMRQARRTRSRVAILLIDLDQFKQVNDSLGHQIGDEMLLEVARRLQQQVRAVDTVARLGGDEFVIVVTDVGTKEDLGALLSQIRLAVSRPVAIERYELHVTPSIGGCMFPEDGEDAGTLMKKADVAMYQVKESGRNSFKWFNESMMRDSQEKLMLGNSMRHALERKEFTLCFQPQVSLSTGLITGCEALLRWRNEHDEDISPTRFVSIAEDTGLIVPLGDWVLDNACRYAVEMQERLRRPLSVAVNVSARQFSEKNWLQAVDGALARSGLKPQCLEMEITESILMHNTEDAAVMLSALRHRGVRIVIDDFGTGFSSLSYLTRFPIDKIKIDQSFVRDLVFDAKDAAVVNAIIAMSKTLHIEVIAEGVETVEQQRYLVDQACDEAQGFFYAKGLPAEEFIASFHDIERAASLPLH